MVGLFQIREIVRNGTLVLALRSIARLLESAGVRYGVCGGFAYAARSGLGCRALVGRRHSDIDISIRSEDLELVRTALLAHGAGVARATSSIYKVVWRGPPVEFFLWSHNDNGDRTHNWRGINYRLPERVFASRNRTSLLGIEFDVVSDPHLFMFRTAGKTSAQRTWLSSIEMPGLIESRSTEEQIIRECGPV